MMKEIDSLIKALSNAERLQDVPNVFEYEMYWKPTVNVESTVNEIAKAVSVEKEVDIEKIRKVMRRKFKEDFRKFDVLTQSVSLAKRLEDIPEVFKYELERKETLSGWVEEEPHFTKAFTDTPRVRHWTERKNSITEMMEWHEPYIIDDMVPDRIALVDAGREDRKTPWLDGDYESRIVVTKSGSKHLVKVPVNTMNDRIFRESCVVYGNTIYPIFQKTSVDINTGTKAEWVAETVGCDIIDAMTMVACWRRMGIDFNMSRRLVRGYWDDTNQVWKPGLQGIGRIRGKQYAKYFEDMSNQLEEIEDIHNELRRHYHEVCERMVISDDWRLKYHQDAPDAWEMMEWIEQQVFAEMDNQDMTVTDILSDAFWSASEAQYEEILDGVIPDPMASGFMDEFGNEGRFAAGEDGFGVRPLCDGSEDIDYELGMEILHADIAGISEIQKRFFRQFNQWTGRWIQARYWWMNPQQRLACWSRINDRKSELAEEAAKHITNISHDVLDMAKRLPGRQGNAMIAAYCAGGEFNMGGYIQKWDHVPNEMERYAVWAQWRQKGETS